MITSSNVHEKNSVQSVLLFTDGIANTGITDTNQILAEVKNFQTGRTFLELPHSHQSKVSSLICKCPLIKAASFELLYSICVCVTV